MTDPAANTAQRVRRTLLNWRWWLMLPVLFAILPAVLVDLALGALVATGEHATDARHWIADKLRPAFRFVRAFAYGDTYV